MRLLWQDFLYAFRVLFKRPGPTFLAIIALSLSIGLTTTTVSVLNAVLFKGFPHPDGPRLHLLSLTHPEGKGARGGIPQALLEPLAREVPALEALCGFIVGTINYSGDERNPERLDGTYITANFLEVVREPVLLGRPFHELSPEQRGDAVLLSHALWQRRYQGNPDIIGHPVRINGAIKRIRGVMPEGFVFPMYSDLWTVLDPADPAATFAEMAVMVVARVGPGTSRDELEREVAEAGKRLLAGVGDGRAALETDPFGLARLMGDGNGLWMGIQLAVMAGLLLIACANVANLLLGRAAARGRELAIRAALGANRRRLIIQLLTESLVLALLGAIGGLLIALWQVDFDVREVNLEMPAWLSFSLDWRVYGFVACLILVVALLAGIIPAFQASRVELNEMLKDGARSASGFRITRFTKILTVTQIAFSCALLFGAGLAARHFQKLSEVDVPFVPEEILTLRLALFASDYPDEASRDAFIEKALARLEEIPGVARAAATSWISQWTVPNPPVTFQIPGEGASEMRYCQAEMVSPGYFETYRGSLITGRGFTAADNDPEAPLVAVVNKAFVAAFLGDEGQAVGRRLDFYRLTPEGLPAPRPTTIVGLAENLFFSPLMAETSESQPLVYLPLQRETPAFVTLVARSTGGTADSLREPIHAALQGIDPHLPPYFVRSMEEYYANVLYPIRMFVSLLLLVSTLALFLAAVGIYSLMAFSVSLRRQEFGVRMAVGARRGNLVRMVLHEGLSQLALGITAGLGLAILLGFAVSGALRAVLEPDPLLLSIILGVLTLATVLALVVPLRRTARLSPMEALRHE
jgi:putative ABC transport system permease protein